MREGGIWGADDDNSPVKKKKRFEVVAHFFPLLFYSLLPQITYSSKAKDQVDARLPYSGGRKKITKGSDKVCGDIVSRFWNICHLRTITHRWLQEAQLLKQRQANSLSFF